MDQLGLKGKKIPIQLPKLMSKTTPNTKTSLGALKYKG